MDIGEILAGFAGKQGPEQPPAIQPPQPRPVEQAGPGLSQKWSDFIGQPQNAAMMLQFGLSLMSGSGLARSVGQGMEARDRNITGRQQAEQRTLDNANEERRLQLSERNTATSERSLEGRDARGLTVAQQADDERANNSQFINFVNQRMRDWQTESFTTPDLPKPTTDDMWEEFQSLLAVMKPGSGAPSLGSAVSGSGPPQVTTPEEWEALPRGTEYQLSDGTIRRKS